MPGLLFGRLPFDEELFQHDYARARDMELTAILDSGAIVQDAAIASLISNGGDTYTVPHYNVLGGTVLNYDGNTDLTLGKIEAGSQTGVVWGRMAGFQEIDFATAMTGEDPIAEITSQVGRFMRKYRQREIVSILKALTTAKATATGKDKEFRDAHIVTTGAPLSVDDAITATTDALGDANRDVTLVFMHSQIAASLSRKKVLEYLKYTDAQGIERISNVATWDNRTVIVDDSCPVDMSGENYVYTTYFIAAGAIRTAPAPVKYAIEAGRDMITKGGTDMLAVRERYTYHPYGFTFVKPSGYTNSATIEQIANADNWQAVMDHKSIGIIALNTLK